MDGSRASSVWTEVAEINEVLAQSSAPFDENRADRVSAYADLARVRATLQGLTVASERLTDLLDALASHYDAPGRAEPPTMHVALDQAAAAAEDLATCAKAAAEATDDML
jgi:uncharacterized protein YceH (UPF0502 family)